MRESLGGVLVINAVKFLKRLKAVEIQTAFSPLFHRFATALHRFATALPPLCNRFATAMQPLCNRFDTASNGCNRFGTAFLPLCNRLPQSTAFIPLLYRFYTALGPLTDRLGHRFFNRVNTASTPLLYRQVRYVLTTAW